MTKTRFKVFFNLHFYIFNTSRLLKMREKTKRTEDGSDVKQVHERDVHVLLSSQVSKPAERLILPKIAIGQPMRQPTGNIKVSLPI